MLNDHKPPQESNAEESILASILLDQEHRKKAFDLLTSEDFYATANSIIFEKCKELQGNGEQIETADIYSALTEDEKKYVKAEFLCSLIDTVPLAVDIESYIKRVKDAAKYRRAIELCNAIAKNAGRSDSEAMERLTQQLVEETKEPEVDSPEQKDTDLSFPYQVMTGAAGYFTNVYEEVVEAPAHFLFMAFFTCLGAAVSPRLTLIKVIS
jgi:replicative DNA helicase